MAVSFAWLQLLSPGSTPPVERSSARDRRPIRTRGPRSRPRRSGFWNNEGRDAGEGSALDVAQRAERLLQLQGVATLLTRTGDTYVSLADRAAIANAQRKCVFISIHFDDAARPAATGVETYYAARQVSNSTRVASWCRSCSRRRWNRRMWKARVWPALSRRLS